jgi:hypothetical protein
VSQAPRVTVTEIAERRHGDGTCEWSFAVRGLPEPVPAARFPNKRDAEKARRRFTRGIELLDHQRGLRPF